MPRLSIPHSDVVVDLLSQVRFAPRAALLKQADNAETLAGEIEPGRLYPEDWLVFRVTGFAPDLAEPRVVAGETLLHDLSSLVEHLTDAAALRVDDAAAAGATAEELCARWGVTRRTIERYRRAGLIARRAVDGSARGRVRLVFSASALAAFERRRGVVPLAAAGSQAPRRAKHLSAEEKAAAVAWAERFHARTNATSTLNQCAARVARRLGRSTASVRRLLASPGVQSSHKLPATGGPLSRRDGRFALRAQRAGVSLQRIARRLGISVPAVHRLITIARFEVLDELAGVPPHVVVEQESAEELTAVAAALSHPLVALDAPAVVLEELAPNAEIAESPPLSAADERAVAMAHAHLRRRVVSILGTADRTRPDASLADEAETKLRHAMRLKRRLLRMTLPLIHRTLRQHAADSSLPRAIENPELRVRCLAAASAAIDGYAPSRSGRLAAPVSLALARELGSQSRGAADLQSGAVKPQLNERICGEEPAALAMPPRVRRGTESLTSLQQQVLMARFGTDATPPIGLAEIEVTFGVTAQAWWALYRRAAKAGAFDTGRAPAPRISGDN